MTMYLLTPEEHAQIVDALNLPSLKTTSMLIQRDEALAMLKAMKSVEPVAIVAKDGFAQIQVGWRKVVSHNTELYAKEHQ